MRTRYIEVLPYDPAWADDFRKIKDELMKALEGHDVSVEHVGSTSVPGMAAKPIIDIDIVVYGSMDKVIKALAEAGYEHEGDLGIDGREAFRYVGKEHLRTHHLYACSEDSRELRRHILFRNWLCSHAEDAAEYSEVKLDAARLYPEDIDKYIEHKSEVIEKIYRKCGLIPLEYEQIFADKLGFDRLEPIERGWSGDRKYKAVRADGSAVLLRLSPIERREFRKRLFDIVSSLPEDIPMSRPIEHGEEGEWVYTTYTWVDGVDAEQEVPKLDRKEQYRLGYAAGQALRKIHVIPVPEGADSWEDYFGRKIDRKLSQYGECHLSYEDGDKIIEFIENNRYLIKGRQGCFQHGDYHVGNMMLEKGEIVIIDFDRFDFGDPWEEFNRIVWCAQAAPAFAAGQIDGYFERDIPEDFFPLMALYIAVNTISSLPWAIPFGQEQIDVFIAQEKEIMKWYDSFSVTVPKWYSEYHNK